MRKLHMKEIFMTSPKFKAELIKAGDSVLHRPTGETWYLLGVNKRHGKVCVAGWPPTIADLADCDLVEKGNGITDDEREYRKRTFGEGWDEETLSKVREAKEPTE